LEKLDAFDRRRQELAAFFRERLADLPGIGVPPSPEHVHHAWHLFIVDLDAQTAGVDREQFIQRLTEQGVGTSVHFIPVHLHPFYAKHLGHQRGDFPGAEAAFERAISLPLYPAMTDEDAEYVVSAVSRALRGDG
jgi:dTDP-4-amino-4,6-dideoxygalactose transaminase